MTGQLPRVETDAAALGTAAHYGIEIALHASQSETGPLSPDEIAAHMIEEFERIAALPNFVWSKDYKRVQVHRYLTNIAQAFYDEWYVTLDPIGIEIGFDNLVIHEDADRIIQIQGTIDLLDNVLGACDWKTAGDARKFQRGFGGKGWELDRWGIQPTVYIQALLLLGLLDPDLDAWNFTYLAFALGGKTKGEVTPQTLTVVRHQGDLDWLVDKCVAYSKLVEAEITTWPKQDNHALCSPTWCPAFSTCKGTHYTDTWPKPSEPRI